MNMKASALSLLCLLSFAARSSAQTDPALVSDAVMVSLFQKRCAECHSGEDDGEDPPLHSLEAVAALRNDPKILSPGQAEKSELFRRVSLPPEAKKRMPESSGAPGDKDYREPLSAGEKDLIRRWIALGSGGGEAARPFLSDLAVDQLIYQDILKQEASSRRGTRYLTLANLNNLPTAMFSSADLATSRAAVTKLLNSLSSTSTITRPTPIDPGKTILRLRLEDYGWDEPFWERVALLYPYAIQSGNRAEAETQRLTGCKLLPPAGGLGRLRPRPAVSLS